LQGISKGSSIPFVKLLNNQSNRLILGFYFRRPENWVRNKIPV
jgi:hypothetical protein